MTTAAIKPQKLPWIIGGVILVLLVIVALANGNDDNETNATEPRSVSQSAEPTTVTVLYEVEGTTDYADVTMATPTGTRQISPDVPMTRKDSGERGLEFTAAPGTFVYISAQNNRGHGTISCRITVDGVVISENESSGGYAIASCDGTAR